MAASASAHKWDDQAHSHLFLSIIEALDITFTQESKDAVVKVMNERYGHNVNWNGIRQHLQKLKKKEGNGAPSLPATPKKPKTPNARTPKSAGGTGRKRKAEQHQNRDEDEDDDEEKIMKKKVKYESADLDHFIKKDPSTAEDGVIP